MITCSVIEENQTQTRGSFVELIIHRTLEDISAYISIGQHHSLSELGQSIDELSHAADPFVFFAHQLPAFYHIDDQNGSFQV